MSRRGRARGFTLVEVLVALLIMAVMAGLAWRGIDGVLRTRDTVNLQMERALRLNTVLGQWSQDLQMVHNTPAVSALAFDGSSVRIVRAVDQGVQLVVWSLKGNTWMRWTGPVVTRQGDLQDSWMRSLQLLGNEDQQLRALEGVASVQVYFYRGNAWSNAQSSGDLAPAEPPDDPPPAGGGASTPDGGASGVPRAPRRPQGQQVQLPGGVRLVLEFTGGPDLPSGKLTRDVALAPQNP